jgi:hypothetical protein
MAPAAAPAKSIQGAKQDDGHPHQNLFFLTERIGFTDWTNFRESNTTTVFYLLIPIHRRL